MDRRRRTESAEGSPPRVRGKVLQNLISQGIVGITPAYAGKRTTGYGYGIRREDHPRVCGEKAPKVVELAAKEGSPPRVRGKVLFR